MENILNLVNVGALIFAAVYGYYVNRELQKQSKELDRKNNLSANLSEDKKIILLILYRTLSGYYGKLDLYEKFECAYRDLGVKINYKGNKKDAEYRTYLLGVFNEMLLVNTQNEMIYKLFRFYSMYCTDANEFEFTKEEMEYVTTCYQSMIYKELVYDFKGIQIKDLYLCEIELVNFKENRNKLEEISCKISKYIA